VWNERRLERIPELFASHATSHGLAEGGADDVHGPDAMRRFVERMLAEFADFRIHIEDALADGERAVVRWVAEGTYRGTVLAPGAAAGQRVRMGGMSMARVAQGQIVESWNSWDIMGLMRQLGAPPAVARLLQ
jgi:steroid delta-isomerase-like uncharacterized protein